MRIIPLQELVRGTPQDLKEQLRGVSNTNRKLIPGILIGQLARFDSTSKKILPGKFLMEDALNRIDCIHKEIGLRFIWLDCEDNPKLKKLALHVFLRD